jgi:hypothetical protein
VQSRLFACVVYAIMIFAFPMAGMGQSCTGCLGTKTYTRAASVGVNSGNNNFNRDSWSPIFVPGSNDIVVFNTSGDFSWRPNNSTTIKGVVLEGNANLVLDRSSEGNNAAFIIEGNSPTDKGCITVKSGSTLTLRYISNLNNVIICVEEGGRIIFDARNEERNDYLFNGVDINLQGPGALIEFGDADIDLGLGGVTVSGYNGGGCNLNPDGSYTLPNPVPNIIADPSKTNVEDFCNFLAAAGFGVLPVEWLYFNADFIGQERLVKVQWGTAKEWESSHFEILRSHGNINDWKNLGSVNAMGWSDKSVDYHYSDVQLPLEGSVIYYQLKQVDLDGKSSYSKVISVRIPPSDKKSKMFSIYPNPTNGDQLKLESRNLEALREDGIRVKLILPNGVIQDIDGVNINLLSENILRNMKIASKGMYILVIALGGEIEYHKIIYR